MPKKNPHIHTHIYVYVCVNAGVYVETLVVHTCTSTAEKTVEHESNSDANRSCSTWNSPQIVVDVKLSGRMESFLIITALLIWMYNDQNYKILMDEIILDEVTCH